MDIKRRHFTGCPRNSTSNIRASLRKESCGDALVAGSFQVTARSWSIHRSHSWNRSITVAGEEKYDGWACVCLELRVTLPGTCLVGRWSWQVGAVPPNMPGTGREQADAVSTVGPCPGEWGWLLRHNFPSPQPMPVAWVPHCSSDSPHAGHAPDCSLWFRGRTPRRRN